MGGSNSFVSKILNNVFPRVADFHGLINEQVAVLSTMGELFEELMEHNNPEVAAKIKDLETKGEELKMRNINVLAKAFATPMDREDIYRIITSIDTVISYLRTSVRTVEVLEITPDEHTLHMAQTIHEGIDSLARGYGKLKTQPALADEDATAVSKAERAVERTYRRALAALLSAESQMKGLQQEQIKGLYLKEVNADSAESIITATSASVMTSVTNILKRREIYRHLSDTADELAKAGGVLHDVVVQIS